MFAEIILKYSARSHEHNGIQIPNTPDTNELHQTPPSQAIPLYCGLDIIVIAAIHVRISRVTASDPLGCDAATHGEVRLRIGEGRGIRSDAL